MDRAPVDPTMLNFPQIVADLIFDHCDYPAIANLRKACPKVRDHLDVNKRQFKILSLTIRQREDRVILECLLAETPKKVVVEYRADPSGCLLLFNNNQGQDVQKMIPGRTFTDIFFNDFLHLLEHGNNFVLQEFNLDFDSIDMTTSTASRDRSFREFSERLEVILAPEPHIKTRDFILRIGTVDHAMNFLPCVDADHLKLIHFKPMVGRLDGSVQQFHNFDNVAHLEQWRRAEFVEMPNIDSIGDVEHFLHFKNIDISWENLDIESMERMMRSIITSGDYSRSFNVARDMMYALFNVRRYGEPYGNKNFFCTTESTHILEVESTWQSFTMALVSRELIPRDARIVNLDHLA